jgi:hypothetical protein
MEPDTHKSAKLIYFLLQTTDYRRGRGEEGSSMELKARPDVSRKKTATTTIIWDVTSRSLMAVMVMDGSRGVPHEIP